MKIKKFLALMCAAATIFISCDDDKNAGLPTIDASIKSRTGAFEVVQERTLTLVGVINSSHVGVSAVYGWTIDGVRQSSTDTVLDFSHSLVGEHVVTFTATNEFGRSTATATIIVRGKYAKGVFVLNEGALGHENGSLIHIAEDGYITENADFAVNGKELGITSQHMFFGNGKIYIVSKSTDAAHLRRVVVLDAETLNEVADYTDDLNTAGLASCDNIGALNNEIFLSASNAIYSFNTQTKAVTKIKNGNVSLVRMYASKGKLFAVHNQNATNCFVKVFEAGKDTISAQINFGANIRSIALADDGNLFVALATTPAEIRKMNINNYSITATNALSTGTFAGAGWSSATQSIFPKGDTIYFYSSTSSPVNIYKHIFSTNETNLVGNIYPFLPYTINYGGIGISPKTGKVYVSTIGGYGSYNTANAITVLNFESGEAPAGADKIKHIEDYIGYTRFAAGIYFPESYE
ncbi:MAG: DUF5074 domain-containing protein [Prevotellaceae bacterium]|jgi:uncharacterized pyridoxamine 5'-phosphate oxidase family protein|nr:DUF5074 domain-containing protein [Prevotellaceae bacterium]